MSKPLPTRSDSMARQALTSHAVAGIALFVASLPTDGLAGAALAFAGGSMSIPAILELWKAARA